jgi:hypothetical protein
VRVKRIIPIGQQTSCKRCGAVFISGTQAGEFSRGECCSLRCSKSRWRGQKRPSHAETMRQVHARKKRKRERDDAEFRALAESTERWRAERDRFAIGGSAPN